MSTNGLARPGLLGRGIRMVLGVVILILGIQTLLMPTAWISATMPRSIGMWFGAAICFYALRGVPDKGFRRAWGYWPQLITASLVILAVVYNLTRTGTWWGHPLGVLIFVIIIYVTTHLGLSFVLASILAHPG